MNKEHAVLYISVFIVMTGYGLTLTVLPFYVERMALTAGADIKDASVHVGLLTGTFALMQFFFAPFWGALSDWIGRRPLIFIGLGVMPFLISCSDCVRGSSRFTLQESWEGYFPLQFCLQPMSM